MSKTLTEEKLLKQLKIDDFRHLSKDTVMRFASSIQRMDPEVAKKALEQFPNFATAVKDGIVEYKELASDVIKSGDKDHDKLLGMIENEHQALVEILGDKELKLDEKFRIMERLDALQDKVEKANKDMWMHRLKVAGGVFGVVMVGVLSLASILGGNSEISNLNDNNIV